MFHFEWSIFFNISIESQTKCNLFFYRSAYILYKQYDVPICDLPTGLSQKLGYHLRLFFFLFTFNLSQYPFDATLLSFVSSPSLKSLPQKRPSPVFLDYYWSPAFSIHSLYIHQNNLSEIHVFILFKCSSVESTQHPVV